MAGQPRVIYLDVDDEITSAAARIRTADASRIAIVIPPGSRVATSRINFRLLAREAFANERQLAIVAGDAASRSLASAAGLDVYRTVGDYEAAVAGPAEPGAAGTTAAAAIAGGAAIAGVTEAAGTAAPSPRGTPAARPSPAAGPPAPPVPEPDAGARRPTPAAGGSSPAGGAGGAGVAGAAGPTTSAEDLRPRSAAAGARSVGTSVERRSVRRWLLGGAAVLVIAALVVGGVLAYLLLPSAGIVLVPTVETVGPVETSVTADPSATSVDTQAGVVPAQRQTFQVQANGTFKATGQKVSETKATGTVTFTSQNTLFDVTVPAGTQVSTDSGVAFLVTKDITVPKASFATGPTSVDTTVTALKAGVSGNVPAHTIVSEPLTLTAALISVTNNQPTSGGTRTVTPKVAQADVDAAKTALQQQLQGQFAQQLQDPASTPSGMTLYPETGKLGSATFAPDPATLVGQEIAQFTLAASATGTATAVDERPVTVVAEAHLRAEVQPGYDLVAGSVKVSKGDPTINGEQVVFHTTATASEVRQLDAAALEAQVRGLPVDQAKEVLSQYGTVTITTWPDWVSTIPSYDFRVDLTIRPSAPVESPSPAPSGPSPSPS